MVQIEFCGAGNRDTIRVDDVCGGAPRVSW